jgi:hypothetical protein
MLTDRELQRLRNQANEAEQAADEIVELRAELDALLAAAPDLLAALREIAEQAEYRLRKGPDNGDEQTLRIARAAIAKATGGEA